MRKNKRIKRGISLGTMVMLLCTIGVLVGFASLMPSFTGNQDILIDAARLAVAMDDSLSQLTASTGSMLQSYTEPQQTIIPPFKSQTSSAINLQSDMPSLVPAATPTPTISPKLSFSLCAAGSIEVDSSVRKALTIDKQERLELLTDQMTQKLQADLSIVTLKNLFSSSNNLSNVNAPSALLDSIRSMGVNAVSIAHSNALNLEAAGIEETAQAVKAAGMIPFGTIHPTALSFNGVNVAILHYQDHFSSTARKQMNEMERYAILPPIDLAQITADIAQARQSGAHVVLVSLGWGEENSHTPNDEQQIQAQAITDAGADIILGTGNGALQPVQVLSANRGDGRYHPVLCAYSLGNLFSPDRDSRVTLASILLKTTVVYDTATQTVAFENLTYTPTYAWRGKDNGRTLQRILINDPNHLPNFVDKNQQGVMERCMTLVTTVMADTAIQMSY